MVNRDKFVDMIRPKSGCDLANDYGYFKGIWDSSNGNPCWGCGSNPCAFLNKKEAKTKEKRKAKFMKVDFQTNAELAKEMGITKRQVSRLKKRGELPQVNV